MKQFISDRKVRLRDFLKNSLQISGNEAKRVIDRQNVFVNNRRIHLANHMIRPGDKVECRENEKKDRQENDLPVLFENNEIIAVCKPPDMISSGSGMSAENLMKKRFSSRITALHRLDKDTSGVLLFAKNEQIRKKYIRLWKNGQVEKEYRAVVAEKVNFQKKKVSKPIDGKEAVSEIITIGVFENYSDLLIRIPTGRKHQIRIHLKSIGHPVLGDREYGMKYLSDTHFKQVSRQLLHAWRIRLRTEKEIIKIEAPFDQEFKSWIFPDKQTNQS